MHLAFDVYGTLIDTAGVTNALTALVGNRAPAFAQLWREKQLEYSFRRALMQNYVPFSVCTSQALTYTAQTFKIALQPEQRQSLLELYRLLPAFADALAGLEALQKLPVHLHAFSNGQPDDLESLLRHAGIRHYFASVVSLYEVQTYKPNPAAYAYFQHAANTNGEESWLISSNPFDVIGALSTGMKAIWLKRSADAIFDPWEFVPTAEVSNLMEVVEVVEGKWRD